MPHRSRKLPTGFISVLATLGFLASPALGQEPLAVTAVHPGGALPGDVVAVSGTGFGQAAEDLFAWADTGDGGFPFEVTQVHDTRLDALLGPVPSAASGVVMVWKGSRYDLADQVVLTQGRLFSASETQVLVTGEAAGGPTFSGLASSPETFGSIRNLEELIIDLELFDPGDGPCRVRVTAVIETSGDSGNSDTPVGGLEVPSGGFAFRFGRQASPPAWAATLTVKTDGAPPTTGALAAGLAEVLEVQLGSLGLTARAEGSTLIVGHSLGIQSGFVNLSR